MAATKQAKGKRRAAGKAAMKDLAVRGRKAKSVRGGLLPAVMGSHNYGGLSNLIGKKVQKVRP